MPEPDWKTDFRKAVNAWVGEGEFLRLAAFEDLVTDVEVAYQRGLMAGRSQSGYRDTRRKREETSCVPSAETPSLASNTGDEP